LKAVKTVFLGLDNGGKTSIILFLERRLALHEPMKPTIHANRSSQKVSLLGLELMHWDLGGHKKYRGTYLKEKDTYFSDISLLFYVIDIKDPNRYEEALDFLKEVLKILEENKKSAKKKDVKTKIFVLFHKYDPNLKNKKTIDKNTEKLKQKILKFNHYHDISFFKTSIYDDISLLTMFSDGAISISDKAKLIQELLKNYCAKTFSSAAILFDTNCLVINRHSKNEIYSEILETVAPILTTSLERLEDYSIETNDVVTNISFYNVENENNKAIIFTQKFYIKNERFYLFTLSKNPKTKTLSYEYLEILAQKLGNILEAFNEM